MTTRTSHRSTVDFDEARAIGLRPAVKVATAAAVMDVHQSTIYRLIKRGSLEGYSVGSDLRIYVDSINAYQRHGDPCPQHIKRARNKRQPDSPRLSGDYNRDMAELARLLG